MTQVLLAVDDTEHSIAAAKAAQELFGATATYTVVNVAEEPATLWGEDALMFGVGYPMVMAPSGGAPVAPRADAPATPAADTAPVDPASVDAAMRVARDVAEHADVPNPQVVGETGRDPAAAIMEAAHHHQADVIVVGSHHRSWFSKLLTPSVGGSLVKDADIPVLVVP